jgi:hypothetical protein
MLFDTVITACDINPLYLSPFPIVHKCWYNMFGVRCKLILISNHIPDFLSNLKDDIILFEPIDGVHNAFTSQVIRILYPCLLDDKIILTTDSDIIPTNSKYFTDNIDHIKDDNFVSFRDKYVDQEMLAICYNVAHQKVWKEIFKINNVEDIRDRIKEWYNDDYNGEKNCPGWFTDQKKLFEHVMMYDKRQILKDNETGFKRMDKKDKKYLMNNYNLEKENFKNLMYSDFHFIRPFNKFKKYINEIMNAVLSNYDKNKILLLENTKIFNKWSSKTYGYKIDCLKVNPNIIFKDIDDDKNINMNQISCIIFGWNVNTESKYYTYKRDYYQKHIDNLEDRDLLYNKISPYLKHINKIQIVQDLHDHDYDGGIKSLIRYLRDNKFNGILTPYLNSPAVDVIQKSIPNIKVYYVPHHIDMTYFKDYGKTKKYDIMIYGNTSPTFYKFRNRLVKILKNTNFKIKQWDGFRNYFKFEPNKANDYLSKAINESWLTVCTSSNYNMLLGKYFETSMSKSVVLGNMANEGKEIWEDKYIHVDDSMTDDDIIQIIKTALDNKEKLIEYSEIMYEKMKEFDLSKYSNKVISEITV